MAGAGHAALAPEIVLRPRIPCAATARDQRLAFVDRPQRERSEVLVTKPEDKAYVEEVVARVTGWMQASHSKAFVSSMHLFI